jgi:hypothetical protein
MTAAPSPATSAPPLRLVPPPPPLPVVEGGFKTLLADPPWRFTNRTGKVAPEHRRLDRYSTLDVDSICELDVQGVVAKDAHLYLWVPNALLPEGLKVMQAWGFRYISIESCSPGPYLEMFARHPREGWSGWGDEAAEDVQPRGQVHKGYEGGALRLPRLDPHVRIPESASDVLASTLRDRYENGASIRQLAEETGYTITRVRTLLAKAGTEVRGRGRLATSS